MLVGNDGCEVVGGVGVAAADRVPARGKAAAGSPRCSNTGASLTKSVDWLAGTFPVDSLWLVVGMIDHLLGHKGEHRDFGRDLYRKSIKWEVGAVVQWSPAERPEAHLSLNGDSLALIPPEQLMRLQNDLAELNFRCSRIDLSADDFGRDVFDLALVEQAGEAGNFSGPRQFQPVKKFERGKLVGVTLYFGSRQSDRFGRFYDKNQESKGEINCIRYEMEFKGKTADLVFECLSSTTKLANWDRKIGNYLGGALDFIDRGTAGAHGHLDRMPRLDFWSRAITLLGRATVTVKHVTPPLQKTLKTMFSQYKKVLGLAFLVAKRQGRDMAFVVDTIMQEGAKVMKGKRLGAVKLRVDFDALLGLPSAEPRTAAAAFLGVDPGPVPTREHWAEKNRERLKWGTGPTIPDGI